MGFFYGIKFGLGIFILYLFGYENINKGTIHIDNIFSHDEFFSVQ